MCLTLPRSSSTANAITRKGSTIARSPNSPLQRSCTFMPKLPVVSITTVKKRNRPTAKSVMLQITSMLRLSRSLLLWISLTTSCLVGFDTPAVFFGLFLLPGGLPGPRFLPVFPLCCAINQSPVIYKVYSRLIILQYVDFVTFFWAKQKSPKGTPFLLIFLLHYSAFTTSLPS